MYKRQAERWAGFLAGDVVALHAVKSRGAIERFRAGRPEAPFAVVLTGTDLYADATGGAGTAAPQSGPAGDVGDARGRSHAAENGGRVGGDSGTAWRHAAESASALVVLQPEALARLDAPLRAKTRVIVQSAPALHAVAAAGEAEIVAVGHLRPVKDPRTLWRAARRLLAEPAEDAPDAEREARRVEPGRARQALPFRIDHIGAALDPALADEARATEAACGGAFRWRGALDHAAARHAIAAARLLVHPSLAEGGAHAVIEAIVSGTAVIASRIDGNVGLLGNDHAGLFPPGDDAALAALVRRFFAEPAFAATLLAQGAALAPRYAPESEHAAVRSLARDLLAAARR